MEFQSDFNKIKRLIDTEEITNIEFSEDYSDEPIENENVDVQMNQTAGKDTLDYLDDYSSAQYKTRNLDENEADLYAIFKKAQEYRKNSLDLKNRMAGGQGDNVSEKKPREMNPTVLLMLQMSKVMSSSIKDPEIKQKHRMQISKIILDDTKKKMNTTDIEKVRETVLKISERPEEFVAKFKKQQAASSQNTGTSGTSSNTRSSRNSRNDRSRSNNGDSMDDDRDTFSNTGSSRNSRRNDRTRSNNGDSVNDNNSNSRSNGSRSNTGNGWDDDLEYSPNNTDANSITLGDMTDKRNSKKSRTFY